MIVRCTAKMLDLLGHRAVTLTESPPSDDDWYLNLLWLDRRKCLLLAHAGTLFSVFVAGVRKADLRPIGPYVVKAVQEELRSESLPPDTLGQLDPDDVHLAKTASRSTLGFMNEMTAHLRYQTAYAGGLSHEEMVASHVLDLEQVLELGGAGTVRGGDPQDVLDADVVVVTAATPLTVNASRLEYLTSNGEIVASLVDLLADSDGWPGVLVVVTNPVDPLCTWIQRQTGIERRRVIGYTLNDSLRLRTGIAKALRVDLGSVEAWVIGEHGDAAVPLFDRVRVAGELVTLTAVERAEAEEFFRTWYVRHVALDSGRSSTWTSGIGVAQMVRAIADDASELWPASVVLEGEYGVEGVSLSVPVSLGGLGARIDVWELSDDDQRSFERAAATVRDATERVGAEVVAIDPKS